MSATGTRRGFAAELDTLVRARYPLVYLVSWEEARVGTIVAQLAARHGKQLITWSVTRGLRRMAGPRATPALEPLTKPLEAFAAIGKLTEPAVVVLHDFHTCLEEPVVVRALRELCQDLEDSYTTILIVSPVLKIPIELEKTITVLDVPLPDGAELIELLRGIAAVMKQQGRTINLARDEAEALVRAAQGLTLSEAENAFARAIAMDDRLDADDIQLVLDEKRQVVRKSGLLEYFAMDDDLGSVGGLEHLKAWLDRRAAAFGDEARAFGLPEPKGLLLLGVQGCGKSLTAKAIASQWKLPLLRLDMGAIFGSLMGSSEANIRRAIKMAEGVAPVVLWVDEIEKGLSGLKSSGETDGGTGARVFGALLTWMQEKTAPVFVVATANRIADLPPELLRKGRFDEIFFIDLPSARERSEIVAIHLSRRQRDPSAFDLAAIATAARGCSGAEIEQAIVAGLYQAFGEKTALTTQHILTALGESRPLSQTMAENIAELREWARTRARLASPAVPDGDA